MNRSSGYNPMCCPAISVKLPCFEIPSQVNKVACRACARVTVSLVLILLNFRSELAGVELGFAELVYRACVIGVHNPDVNSFVVNQRHYRTFDVIKSIAIECVRAQQGVCESKYDSRRRNGFTEQ